LSGEPLNDASYPLEETILNYFPPPAKNAPFIIPLTICIGIVVCVLGFLHTMFNKIGVNLN